MPTVSVIIPVYKSMEVLETAVESARRQSFSDFEILLIDDGSPDDSLKLCQRLSEADERIRVLHKENGGISSARNYGIAAAKGTYLAFLDHDDEYLPGYLEDNVVLLEKYQADVVKFERVKEKHWLDGRVTVLHGERIRKMPGIENHVVCYREGQIAEQFPAIREAAKTMYIWDGIYRTSFFREYQLRFDESFRFGHEDIMLNLEILSHAKSMVFHDGEYYKHKYRETTSTSAVFHRGRIDDSVRTAVRESCLLSSWGYPDEQILYSYMNSLFVTMNILSLPDAAASSKRKAFFSMDDAFCPRRVASSPSGRDIRRAKRGGVSTASLSLKAKKELLEHFRSETIGKMEALPLAVKKLFHMDKLHGLLAWLFMKRQYSICLVGFRIYFRMTNTGEEA